MQLITFYKLIGEYDAEKGGFYAGQGRYRFGYHFEQGQGYLFEAPYGVKVAIEKIGNRCWRATEITSGSLITGDCDSRTEAIEKSCIASPAVRKVLNSGTEYITAQVEALKEYAERQRLLLATA